MVMIIVAVAAALFSNSGRSDAESDAAAAEALADVALDSAQASRERLAEGTRLDSIALAAQSDSTALYALRLAQADTASDEALEAAEDATGTLRQTLDADQVVLLDSIDAEHAKVRAADAVKLTTMTADRDDWRESDGRGRSLLAEARTQISSLEEAAEQHDIALDLKDALIRSAGRREAGYKIGGGIVAALVIADKLGLLPIG